MASTNQPTESPLLRARNCRCLLRSVPLSTPCRSFCLDAHLHTSCGVLLLLVLLLVSLACPNDAAGVAAVVAATAAEPRGPAVRSCEADAEAEAEAAKRGIGAALDDEFSRISALNLLQLASEGHRRGEGGASVEPAELSELQLDSARYGPEPEERGGDLAPSHTGELLQLLGSPNATQIGRYRYQRSNTSPEATALLQSTKPSTINLAVCLIFGSVVAVTAVGCLLGNNSWVLAMILASYAVLIPGLFSKDFSFNIAMVMPKSIPLVGGTRFQVTYPHGQPGPVRESTRSLVPLLWDTGSAQGAILIFCFAFVVPVVKLALLLLARQWRASEEKHKVQWAIYSIWSVQVVSKWASPDMFAIALLYTLLRSVSVPPILESLAVLDLGFTCYNIFCASSVLSTLAVQLPPDPYPRAEEGSASPKALLPQRLALFGCLAGIVLWTMIFVVGANRSCLSMSLDTTIVLKALDLPTSLAGVASLLKLDDLIHAEISVMAAAEQYWHWFWESGELNLLLAFTMLGGFGIALTVASISLLLMLTLLMSSGSRSSQQQWLLRWLLSTSHVVRHIAMLDVVIVGLCVVSFAASIYKEQGIVIEIEHGICYLIASEVLHNLLFWSVHHIGKLAKEKAVGDGQSVSD